MEERLNYKNKNLYKIKRKTSSKNCLYQLIFLKPLINSKHKIINCDDRANIEMNICVNFTKQKNNVFHLIGEKLYLPSRDQVLIEPQWLCLENKKVIIKICNKSKRNVFIPQNTIIGFLVALKCETDEWEEVDDLLITTRGYSAFGSTGKY